MYPDFIDSDVIEYPSSSNNIVFRKEDSNENYSQLIFSSIPRYLDPIRNFDISLYFDFPTFDKFIINSDTINENKIGSNDFKKSIFLKFDKCREHLTKSLLNFTNDDHYCTLNLLSSGSLRYVETIKYIIEKWIQVFKKTIEKGQLKLKIRISVMSSSYKWFKKYLKINSDLIKKNIKILFEDITSLNFDNRQILKSYRSYPELIRQSISNPIHNEYIFKVIVSSKDVAEAIPYILSIKENITTRSYCNLFYAIDKTLIKEEGTISRNLIKYNLFELDPDDPLSQASSSFTSSCSSTTFVDYMDGIIWLNIPLRYPWCIPKRHSEMVNGFYKPKRQKIHSSNISKETEVDEVPIIEKGIVQVKPIHTNILNELDLGDDNILCDDDDDDQSDDNMSRFSYSILSFYLSDDNREVNKLTHQECNKSNSGQEQDIKNHKIDYVEESHSEENSKNKHQYKERGRSRERTAPRERGEDHDMPSLYDRSSFIQREATKRSIALFEFFISGNRKSLGKSFILQSEPFNDEQDEVSHMMIPRSMNQTIDDEQVSTKQYINRGDKQSHATPAVLTNIQNDATEI